MTEIKRIRWEPTECGGWTGHVGTRPETDWLFQIWSAAAVGGDWQLDSTLPGRFGQFSRADAPATLKAEAERWLEEFISSLGAIFPDEPGQPAALQLIEARSILARWDAEQGSKHVIERVLADQVRALLAIADQSPAPRAATEKE